ncbi:protein FATTY ACID EXPORT 1, chloroplastic-like [Primulina huaijiensis]|uniref:protein FATTY ACID EXPORT 1, chloroplastic-like n=1 Tax=Primulina huaijiensis TaxID=1492673 RepID=UPI003CC76E2B
MQILQDTSGDALESSSDKWAHTKSRRQRTKDGSQDSRLLSWNSLRRVVLSGGLIGFIFTRNSVNLSTGVLFGGALLALSIYSLKVWRQGKSSLPFILGQSVLFMALFWKIFQTYALTQKLFPTCLNTVISAAMPCFYLYVVISGGNPPPKKLESLTAVESS